MLLTSSSYCCDVCFVNSLKDVFLSFNTKATKDNSVSEAVALDRDVIFRTVCRLFRPTPASSSLTYPWINILLTLFSHRLSRNILVLPLVSSRHTTICSMLSNGKTLRWLTFPNVLDADSVVANQKLMLSFR